MPTDLSSFIETTPLCDTHEHMFKEQMFLDENPDIIQALFCNYVRSDFLSAGASEQAITAFLDSENSDIRSRVDGIYKVWEKVQFTGYGEAVRIAAKKIYGIDEITPDSVAAATGQHAALVQPGQRLHLLRDVANLDHIQTDDFCSACLPDTTGPDFFFYDISLYDFCRGTPDLEAIAADTGTVVHDLNSLRTAMESLFEKYAPVAVAVKSQHAYKRTLAWHERTDADADRALAAHIKNPDSGTGDDHNCLGDWCLARGAELCAEHNLPFKIHTGHYAGNNMMPVDFIRSGNMCELLAQNIDTNFVLMHIAYPFTDELLSIAKHYSNVYVDLCWAWSIDPHTSADFVRAFIHTVPANKLFVFGGDTNYPMVAVGYAIQARAGLNRALQAEVDAGLLSEPQAIKLAKMLMRDNQYELFRIEAKRQACGA